MLIGKNICNRVIETTEIQPTPDYLEVDYPVSKLMMADQLNSTIC